MQCMYKISTYLNQSQASNLAYNSSHLFYFSQSNVILNIYVYSFCTCISELNHKYMMSK